MAASSSIETNPADSALLSLILGSLACPGGFDFDQEYELLYEIGAAGEVLSRIALIDFNGEKLYGRSDPPAGERFIVEDGCLVFEHATPGDERPDIDPTELPAGPCPLGQAAVGSEGLAYGQPQGDYICVQTESASVCHDCWFDGGAWHDEMVTSITYVALDSLDDAVDRCSDSGARVSIRSGDRATFTSRVRTTFRVSPGPEELGYQEMTVPTFP